MFENLIETSVMETLLERLTSYEDQKEFLQNVEAKRIMKQMSLILKKFTAANFNP